MSIKELWTAAHRVPLPESETDGTLAWSATTVVTVVVTADGEQGLGWTYGPAAVAGVVDEVLAPAVRGLDPHDIGRAHLRMRQASRNAPTPGLTSYGISAVDVALWDLKARLLGIPLSALFGQCRDTVAVYGSGGFTSMTDDQLCDQLAGWVSHDGMTAVKIKIGEARGGHVTRDLHRVAVARDAVGADVTLMIDANGAYDTKQALAVAADAARLGVTWFEEPVSSDRLADLALLRSTATTEITAGEYGTTTEYFRRMCGAGAVDCLQVDATRCGGYTGLFAAAAVADAFGLQVSTHCGPHLHAPACAALPNLRHAEWFADHVRADAVLFDGLAHVHRGAVQPQRHRPGHGMHLRQGLGPD
ncbi:enolase C-terminal domain-like protein [Krasilnikovia sp. MM14-A1259]|uniref:enolase C-terminal domain-like protein n=1 Tax=Krasilnikovia sp. MM14-A1259 TaxID=3373539 RepID=UPI0037F72CD3